MIAIVESGSTKSDWRVVAPDGTVQQFVTAGFNPFFTNANAIADELSQDAALMRMAPAMRELHFYGAGCSSEEMNRIVADGLKVVFPQARVHVDHDLMGAALAAGKGGACIVCILGTGSNACFFDGERIDNGRPSLGFILGDEGSGAWFGKRLLADHLHGLTPAPLSDALIAAGADRRTVLERIYRQPRPNTYLAGFMPTLHRFRAEPYVQELMRSGFTAFLERYVQVFPHRDVPLHFVGSVAYFFREELDIAAEALGLSVGRVERQPVDALVRYHLDAASGGGGKGI
jgi:glucosamine kinase